MKIATNKIVTPSSLVKELFGSHCFANLIIFIKHCTDDLKQTDINSCKGLLINDYHALGYYLIQRRSYANLA